MPPKEKKLEIEIDRLLKALPELEAPDSLLPRVMQKIHARPAARSVRSWSEWAAGLRLVSLAALLVLFAGLCVAGGAMSDSIYKSAFSHLSGLSSLWRVSSDLAEAGLAAFLHLGVGAIAGICAAWLFSYGIFLALGAAYFRLGFAISKSAD